MNDPLFDKVYNQAVLKALTASYGPFQHHHADLVVAGEGMLDFMEKMDDKARRGEVVMVVPNEQGHVWLHTKAFYPPGTYRLMTGGLEGEESPDETLAREVAEETGFQTKIDRCLAVITYTFSSHNVTVPFVSYLFLTAPTNGFPQPTDPDEAIIDFQAVPVEALADTARALHALEGDFADWGRFRAIAHEIAWQQLAT